MVMIEFLITLLGEILATIGMVIFMSAPLVGLGAAIGIIAGIVLIYVKLKNNRDRLALNPTAQSSFEAENEKIKKQMNTGVVIIPVSCLIIFILLYLESEKCSGFGCIGWAGILVLAPPAIATIPLTIMAILGLKKVNRLEKKILEAEKNMQQAVGFEKLVQENAENTWQIDTERQNAHEDSAQKNAENP